MGPRLSTVETELRSANRLLTSLANRVLEDKPSATLTSTCGSSGRSPSHAGSQGGRDPTATDGMMEAITTVIRGALGGVERSETPDRPLKISAIEAVEYVGDEPEVRRQSGRDFHDPKVPVRPLSPLKNQLSSVPVALSVDSTAAEFISDHDASMSLQNESEGSHHGGVSSEGQIREPSESSATRVSTGPQSNIPDGLMSSLQGLAQAIDKTLGRQPTLSPEPVARDVRVSAGSPVADVQRLSAVRGRSPANGTPLSVTPRSTTTLSGVPSPVPRPAVSSTSKVTPQGPFDGGRGATPRGPSTGSSVGPTTGSSVRLATGSSAGVQRQTSDGVRGPSNGSSVRIQPQTPTPLQRPRTAQDPQQGSLSARGSERFSLAPAQQSTSSSAHQASILNTRSTQIGGNPSVRATTTRAGQPGASSSPFFNRVS